MQQPKTYDWNRFWYPQGTQVKVCDRGYLIDPISEWSKHTNPDLVELEKLADIPCLVLLGEPGIGKSHEINLLQRYREGLTDDVLPFPLRSCINLRQDLLHNEQFIAWHKGKHRLCLFLDSLDEGLAESKTLATQLVDILKARTYRKELKRLYIRLACRDAVFPQTLEEGLKELYGQDYAAYQLAHLRRIDIERAATEEGIESQKFVSEVERKNLTPFAVKPITLRFLFRVYKESRQFSENQTLTDLYLQGCRTLCDEDPNHPHRPGISGNLELDDRLIVAAQIATATMLCNRDAVWIGRYGEHNANQDADCRELTSEKAKEQSIREVLKTGLFSRYSFYRIGWAHRTYAEFLTAWYLAKNNLDLPQLESLTFNEGRVVPQLADVAKWLASMRSDFLQKVIKTDANILIKGDLSSFDRDTKSEILDSFLKLHNAGKAAYRENGEFIYQNSFAHYKQLNYPELPEQLSLYISDISKNIQSKYVAIDIAEECNLVTIASDLAKIALDENQPYQIRERAAKFVVNTDNDLAHKHLAKLVIHEQDDPEDHLKGYGLKATYPKYLKTEEILVHLTPPKANYFGESYQDFLAHDFTERLPKKDLAFTLRWFARQEVIHDYNYHPFTHLISQLIFRAWENLTDLDVRTSFAQMIVPRMKQYIGIVDDYDEETWKKCIEGNDDKRRLLLESIVLIIQDSEQDPLWLCSRNNWSQFYLLPKDFSWLIEKLKTNIHEGAQKIYSRLIAYYLDMNNVEQVDNVILACDDVPVLRDVLSHWIDPIALDSEIAKEQKEQYLKRTQYETNQESQVILEPSPKARVLQSLERFEAGNLDGWWLLCRAITLLPNTVYGQTWRASLTEQPGWNEADEATRFRIIAAAKHYIYNGDPETNVWLGKNIFPDPALSSYKALRLILEKDADFFSNISSHIWAKWVGIILAYPLDRNRKARQELIKKTYQYASNEFIRIFFHLIEKANKENGNITNIKELKYCWDEKLEATLLCKLNNTELTSRSLKDLLAILLEYQSDGAVSFAESLLTHSLNDDNGSKEKAITAAQALITYTGDATWPTVWQLIQTYPDIGREILESVSFPLRLEDTLEQRLSENHIAELYIFMVRQFPDPPPQEQVNVKGTVRNSTDWLITPENSLSMWKERIPAQLQQLGTVEACQALQRIINELPEQKEKLQWRLAEAEALARRKTWQPLIPQQLLQIIADQNKRLVQNENQLVDVLIESLQRLDEKLQGETPATRALWDKSWDKSESNLFRPVDENDLSDYIKQFLDEDLKARGIIINREVEVKRSYGKNTGARTDIHVDAIVKHPNGKIYDSITAIIEVKGCWHREVKTAMKTQLVERYLADNAYSHGLYLVGWFACPQWDAEDSRHKDMPKMDLGEAKHYFEQQAKDLTSSAINVRSFVLNTALR
ncbi:MAG: hypothetical protein AAF821_11360 [Cyanobacteria bacterium P01_D01_bin.156]